MANRVDDFLARLAANAPKEKKEFEQNTNRSLEKVFLNFPGNFGRYQVFPMSSIMEESGLPFVTLFNTREINIPKKKMTSNGTEEKFDNWIKILPRDAYQMKDMNGRVVSSLTALDEQILNQAYAVWDEIWNELDARNNLDITKSIVRRRNYTLFHAYCLNYWAPNESRNPNRQNFSALFVCTAKGFTNIIQDNIQEKALMNGGNYQWVEDIYNRQTSGRTGFLMFSVNSKKDGGAGFSITTTHEIGNTSFQGIQIPEEDAIEMSDPIYTFLGYQANRDEQNPVGQKRLFNQTLMKEAIAYMSEMLAGIKARQASEDAKDVARQVAAEIFSRQQAYVPKSQTNDPMLAASQGNAEPGVQQPGVVNPGAIVNNNDNPFATSPVYHSDPVTGQPVNPGFGGGWNSNPQPQGAAPFNPNFGGFGSNEAKDGLPF